MNNTKTRTFIPKLTMVAFLFAMVLLLMPMNTFAAKKPGQVKNIEEVKATDKSVTINFKKASSAKSYQIQVYEATRSRKVTSSVTEYGNRRYKYTYTWKTGKTRVKNISTKKTTYTIKGLSSNKSYAIKVRACNGKTYGKWTTQYMWTTFKGIRYPGNSAATGTNLKKQYDAWKKPTITSISKETKMSSKVRLCYSPASSIKCTEEVHKNIDDPGKYSMDEVYETYRRGYGTDLEIYHVCMDFCKTAGVRCEIKKYIYPDGSAGYQLLGYYNEKIPVIGSEGLILDVTPRHVLQQAWYGETD